MRPPCPNWPACHCPVPCCAYWPRRARPGFWLIAGALLAAFAVGTVIAFVGRLI